MARQDAIDQYTRAQKAAQKCYKDCMLHGKYPYPHVLDEMLDDELIAGRVDLGIVEIPMDHIVGTKTVGRRVAFAANFLPLLPVNSEFAEKWMDLCAAHLGEGIRDPIRCFEYLGRFYVQEGNKRVSVLKSYGAPTISAYVTRLLPVRTDEPEIEIYYEFLDFYRLSRLYQVDFTQLGSYAKLQATLGYEPDHVWTEDERRRFLSSFTYFREAFSKLGGESLPVTAGDALLVWLGVYPFEDLKNTTATELTKSLSAVWQDVKVQLHPEPIAVSTEAGEPGKGNLLTKIVSSVFPTGKLQVAFINERDPSTSNWVLAHDQGRQYLERSMGDQVEVAVYNHVVPGENAEEVMAQAIDQGAQVLFTTTAPLIGDCRKIAARFPHVHILNCSVSMPYTGVRTYYSRIYEGKFISGAIAGAMARSDRIGYVASNPIFGVPAGVNAFALGAQLTNPRARVRLRWSCRDRDPVGELTKQGVNFISTLDIPTPEHWQGQWGACQVQPDGSLQLLASPYWNWGAFYVKLVGSILSGSWDALDAGEGKAVSYWWGMSSGVVGLRLSPLLPEGVVNLVQILQRGICDGSISPFHRHIRSQDGALRNDGGQWLTPEEILHMDWLCDSVDGEIPEFDELMPQSRAIVRLQGVYRDRIPPEKEKPIL